LWAMIAGPTIRARAEEVHHVHESSLRPGHEARSHASRSHGRGRDARRRRARSGGVRGWWRRGRDDDRPPVRCRRLRPGGERDGQDRSARLLRGPERGCARGRLVGVRAHRRPVRDRGDQQPRGRRCCLAQRGRGRPAGDSEDPRHLRMPRPRRHRPRGRRLPLLRLVRGRDQGRARGVGHGLPGGG